ncbi:MAG: ribosomal-protein-alanine N-acetyltransferase [Chloroflexi bacterium]|nr:ribosomal-protein-alanine N-acetyltransferase [Chloroflexota bacterium]
MTTIEPMTLADVPQVAAIDRLSFALPWSELSYSKELTENANAHFFVAVETEEGGQWLGRASRNVIGFCGYWFIVDEAHISTIAVHPQWRGRGVGELLLTAMLRHALAQGAVMATLEVRESNAAARGLYRKYGFEVVGQRKHYYRDNGEDAILMTARPIRIMMNTEQRSEES